MLLLLLRQPRSEFPNLRGKIQSVGLCTQYTNEMCALFAPVLTAVQIPQNVLTYNLALGQETVAIYTVIRSRGATQRAR